MATLVRWEPFREIAALQNEMSRFMNGLLEGNGRTNQAWVPALDAWETESEIVYTLDLPGIPDVKISVELDEGALTITAERARTHAESEERFYRFELRVGAFFRTYGPPVGSPAAVKVFAISSISPTQRHPFVAADRSARVSWSTSWGIESCHSASNASSTALNRATSRIASRSAAVPFVQAAYTIFSADA